MLELFSLIFAEAHMFRQTSWTSTSQTSSGPELQFFVSDISLWKLLFKWSWFLREHDVILNKSLTLLSFLLVCALYSFHTGICSCKKRTVVNQYTMVKKNLKLVWSVYMLIPIFSFSLLYISKYFTVKKNLDKIGEIHAWTWSWI